MRRIISLLLAILMTFTLSSCSQKNEKKDEKSGVLSSQSNLIVIKEESTSESKPEQVEPETETDVPEDIIENSIKSKQELSEEFKYLEGLSTDQVPWGPGTNYNSDGKPTACVLLQEDYGQYSADFVKIGEENIGKVFLTFDEGYENGYTDDILDILKEKNVPAVFFVTLSYVKSCPDLVRRMIDEGHIVGNHTARHPNMTQISPDEGYDEVADLHKYMADNFGYSMYLFRYPEGAFSEQNLALLQSMGYRNVFWSFAYSDWDPDNQMDTEKAFSKVTGSLHDGEIFLLHAVSSTNTEILGRVIDYIRENGYTIAKYENK